ncbi:hypothetical protein PHYPO_G00144220 [Pangasianodon hypophthalmus]|uniref:Uncharacterized protein n=1 Tax=Pangasianodon hypophthalmus TaxID=310915 RepID=A0A5N5K4M8_PANHP|nr:hypothetical protein PHYPO_G00144220 [Pangasianodon hypophthalmus]
MATPDRRYRNDSVPLNIQRHDDFYQDTSKNDSENWDCSNDVIELTPVRRYRNDSVPLNIRRHDDFYTSKNNSIRVKKQRYNTPTTGNSRSSDVGNVPRIRVTNQLVDMVTDMIVNVLKDYGLTAAGEIKSVAEYQEVMKSMRYSVKSGAVSGMFTIIGGLLGGPAGVAIGGAFGAAVSYFMTKDKFKPVPKILKDLPLEEKMKICLHMIAELPSEISKFTDSRQLIKYVKANVGLQQKVKDLIGTFFSNNPLLLH